MSVSPLPKFIQIHFLAAWPGALLNRDDAGLAKRLPFGSAVRTRVSSQCLKRHWRVANDPRALHELATAKGIESERSKQAIERDVMAPLCGHFATDMIDAVQEALIVAVYGKNAKDSRQRQALLLGRPELNYLRESAEAILKEATDAKSAKAAAETWAKEGRLNLAQLREQNALAPGLESALFGRMVTSDPAANTDAAIHVAHAFTVHEERKLPATDALLNISGLVQL